MTTMKFKNVLQPPTQDSEDGMYYVKKGDKFEPVMVSDGVPYGHDSKLITTYTHEGNHEIFVESAEYDIFHAPNHGMSDGDLIFPSLRGGVPNGNIITLYGGAPVKAEIPYGSGAGSTQGYNVAVVDEDNFKLTDRVDNVLESNPACDFEYFKFERQSSRSINFSNLSEDKVKMVISGNLPIMWHYMYLTNTTMSFNLNIGSVTDNNNVLTSTPGASIRTPGRNNLLTHVTAEIDATLAHPVMNLKQVGFGFNNNGVLVGKHLDYAVGWALDIEKITRILIDSIYIANGTTFKIYKGE